MLAELEIRNLGPIRHALLQPGPGMTAITGETGAGKSMLLNAIRLISGGSADAGRVSAEAEETWVQGVFDVEPDSTVALAVRDAGIDMDADECELFVTRTVPASGRSRALISGRSVPRSLLQGISHELVTIHGQSDQLRIASGARQREFLDAFAHDAALMADYREAWSTLTDLDRRIEGLLGQERDERGRAEYLEHAIAKIEQVDPHPGEVVELKEQRDRIEHATQITQGVEAALAALDNAQIEADDSIPDASTLILRAAEALRSIHVGERFDQLASRLDSVHADLADVVFSLADEVDGSGAGGDLDAINERIHALDELVRNWGPGLEDVLTWREEAQLELEDLDASPEKIEALKVERQAAFERADALAHELNATRRQAAERLEQTVNAELASLAMQGASLHVSVSAREPSEDGSGGAGSVAAGSDVGGSGVAGSSPAGSGGAGSSGAGSGGAGSSQADSGGVGSLGSLDAHGMDAVTFLFTPFPGAPQMPLGKSASGGELSRLMLALELAAADPSSSDTSYTPQKQPDSPMTFIFDEVDAGVGGRSAVELAKRLARLAEHAQVIVVTHLAQVASWADTQYVVSKGETDASSGRADAGAIAASVAQVDGEARVHEIARMLSGSESSTSLDHARELLDSSSL